MSPNTPKTSRFINKKIVTALLGLFGCLLALGAGISQFNYERKDTWIKAAYETETIASSVNQQLLRAREVTRLFQSSFMLSSTLSPHVAHSNRSDEASVHIIEEENGYEAELARAYNEINPKSLFPAFETLIYSQTNDGLSFSLTSSYPLKKEILTKRWVQSPKDQKAFSEAVATNFITVSFSEADPSLMIFNLPLIEHGKAHGIISLAVSKEKVFQKAKKSIPPNERKFAFVVVDVTSSPHLVYQSDPVSARVTSNVDKDLTNTIAVGNRLWEVRFYQIKNTPLYFWPVLTLLLILAATALSCVLMYRVLNNKDNAETRAIHMLKKFLSADTKFRHVTENMPGIVLVLDEDGFIVEVNKNGRSVFNIPPSNILSKDKVNILDIIDDTDLGTSLGSMEVGDGLSLPVIYSSKNSKSPPLHFNISLSKVVMDEAVFVIVLGHDMTGVLDLSQQLEAQSQKLHFLATHDQLTGLFNRRAFEEKVDHLIQSGGLFSLLYVDLDQFKIVNDTAGHFAGDRLLQQLSSEIQDDVRHCFSRLGGDEFGMLVEGDVNQAMHVAEKIIEICKNFVFTWEGTVYQVTASVGVADIGLIRSSLARPVNKEDLMSRADAACYTSKKRGRNRYHVFSNEGESLTHQQEMEWTVKITQAMSENRIVLYRQSIVPLDEDKKKNSLPHFEILSRMFDENGNIVPASEFIPAIERFGLHLMFDKWVLRQTLENFDDLHPDGFEMCSVNVSGQTIDDPDFEIFLFDLIEKTGIDPTKLCLEITETATISNMNKMRVLLPKIKKTGCKLALDDFGVGMSSFAYLKNFDVDYVKIDGSFVRDIENSFMSSSIVSAVTDIAHKMGIKVVAEWVSSDEVLTLLKERNVDFGQGFHLSKPEPVGLNRR